MCPSLIEIGSKTAEKNSAQTRGTNRQTHRQTDTTKIMVTWRWTNNLKMHMTKWLSLPASTQTEVFVPRVKRGITERDEQLGEARRCQRWRHQWRHVRHELRQLTTHCSGVAMETRRQQTARHRQPVIQLRITLH